MFETIITITGCIAIAAAAVAVVTCFAGSAFDFYSKELDTRISGEEILESIKKLEEQLNCNLFVRNKFGVILTEEGEYFSRNTL